METLFAGLEGSAFAAALRSSVVLYPLANVVHVLAALVFFAAVAAMDARILRAAARDEVRPFVRRVRPLAVGALIVQIVSGLALFAPEATHIAHNPVFRIKLLLIAVALANVLLLEALLARAPGSGRSMLPPRGTAAASLLLWLCVAAAGRLIAYF